MKHHSRLALLLFLLIASPLTWAVAHTGTVLETMNSGGYIYAKVTEKQKEFWIAGPVTGQTLHKGDTITFRQQMWMSGFTSKTLGRTFKKLLFVDAIRLKSDSVPKLTESMHSKMVQSDLPTVKISNLSKASGGYRVAEVYEQKATLKGKIIKVHGEVVKVSNGIMQTNWVHIQDGSGKVGSNDLIFRSKTDTAKVGSRVIAEGTLATDQDLGYGYKYPVLVEDASFKVDP